MATKSTNKKRASISFPLTGLRPLYSTKRGTKLVIEVDVKSMKEMNTPNTIDEMVAEAKLEYFLGKTKTFTSAEALVRDLRS